MFHNLMMEAPALFDMSVH